MPTYTTPGVYVEEVASGSAPIAGVGTSTAGFIGIVPDTLTMAEPNPNFIASQPIGQTNVPKDASILKGKTLDQSLTLVISPATTIEPGELSAGRAQVIMERDFEALVIDKDVAPQDLEASNILAFDLVLGDTETLSAGSGLRGELTKIRGISPGIETVKIKATQKKEEITSADALVGKTLLEPLSFEEVAETLTPSTIIDDALAQKIVTHSSDPTIKVKPFNIPYTEKAEKFAVPTPTKTVKLCTNFSEFKQFFGDFSLDLGQSQLAHAVYGFFRNGGTRCYVVRVTAADDIKDVLDNQFAAIDEIALVAAPGVSTKARDIADHCAEMQDRFAILDGPEDADLTSSDLVSKIKSFSSDYAALYFPWIEVYDLATRTNKPMPPSGHMAGIYARVDTQRGVHKAPANEAVLGAKGLAYNLSKAKQGPLNQEGINCIRSLNGNILVWGARTLGGDANGEFKYISTRRLFNYLCESIDEGLQWTVFEPNSPELWAAIRRNVNAFLTMVWRSGALFGATPEQAFYVKCDAENNPLEQRESGQVVTEIGVAVVKPAEFVVFRLSQWSGNEG